jgi:hypothetical protein
MTWTSELGHGVGMRIRPIIVYILMEVIKFKYAASERAAFGPDKGEPMFLE